MYTSLGYQELGRVFTSGITLVGGMVGHGGRELLLEGVYIFNFKFPYISINACLRQRTCERSKESHGFFGSHMERRQMKDARGLVIWVTDEHVVISGVPHLIQGFRLVIE